MSASIEQIWNIAASRQKLLCSPTFIFCSPICSNNCGVVFLWKYILVFEKWFFSYDRSNMQTFIVNITRVVLHDENLHIWAVEQKDHFSKTRIYLMILTTLLISCVKKRMRDSTRGLKNTRRCIIKVGVQIVILFEKLVMLHVSVSLFHLDTLLSLRKIRSLRPLCPFYSGN